MTVEKLIEDLKKIENQKAEIIIKVGVRDVHYANADGSRDFGSVVVDHDLDEHGKANIYAHLVR